MRPLRRQHLSPTFPTTFVFVLARQRIQKHPKQRNDNAKRVPKRHRTMKDDDGNDDQHQPLPNLGNVVRQRRVDRGQKDIGGDGTKPIHHGTDQNLKARNLHLLVLLGELVAPGLLDQCRWKRQNKCLKKWRTIHEQSNNASHHSSLAGVGLQAYTVFEVQVLPRRHAGR